MSNTHSECEQIEELIRDGKGERAREAVLRLVERGVEREACATLAQLAWRVEDPELGLRVLHRHVRASQRRVVAPKANELAEYAVCLVKSGAVNEGESLLVGLNARDYPRIFLYRAFVAIARWEYAAAINDLKSFVEEEDLTPYEKLVGNANLAACLVYLERTPQAEFLLRRLISESSLHHHRLLHVFVLDLAAKYFIRRKQYSQAEDFLARTGHELPEQSGLRFFFVEKWKTFLALRLKPDDEATHKAVAEMRDAALKKKHWESVRDCDRALAVARKDMALFTFLHFGTPFSSYRQRLVEELKPSEALPEEIVWSPGNGSDAGSELEVTLDLETGALETKGAKKKILKPGSQLQRLLVILSTDFYRPTRAMELSSRLYPDEVFNPESSPLRVYQAVKRAREWFAKQGLPLELVEKDGAYWLQARRNVGLRIRRQRNPQWRTQASVSLIARRFAGQTLTRVEFMEALALPERSARRLLENAVKSGEARRIGTGKTIRYVF